MVSPRLVLSACLTASTAESGLAIPTVPLIWSAAAPEVADVHDPTLSKTGEAYIFDHSITWCGSCHASTFQKGPRVAGAS